MHIIINYYILYDMATYVCILYVVSDSLSLSCVCIIHTHITHTVELKKL
jgi:hypothetical protein